MELLRFTVRNQNLSGGKVRLVSDSIDYVEASFDFRTDDWSGLSKWAHFTKDDVVYDINLVDDKITKDMHLNLDVGTWEVKLHGTDAEGTTRITTDTAYVTVESYGNAENENPLPEIPLSAAEQIDAKSQNAVKTAGEAKTTAEEALSIVEQIREAAANGEFDGATGATGKTPEIQIGKVTTLPPNVKVEVTIEGTPEKPILNFAIPKGNPGDNGVGIESIETESSTEDGGMNHLNIILTNGAGYGWVIRNGTKGAAGSSGLVWQGEWNEEISYSAIKDGQISRDVVSYNGSSYVVAVNNTAPVKGVVPEGDTTGSWVLLAAKGEAGEAAEENPITLDRILRIEKDLLEIEGKVIDGWRMDSKGFLYLLAGEAVAVGPIGPFSGGGGGSATGTYTITLTNLLADRILTVPEGKEVLIKFNYSSEDSDGFKDGNGIGQVLVEGNVKKTFTAVQGDNEVDIGPYLVSGANNVSIKVTNSENISKQLPYTVTVAALKLTSTFDAAEIRTGAFQFPYTPTGIAEKTVHIELDGTELEPVVVTTSGREQKYPIPAQSHGAHVIRAWFTSVIGEDEVSSNELYYSFICTEAGNNAPIIAISKPHQTKAEQYENIATKYRVYNPKSLTALISLEADGEVLKEITVDRTEQTWSFRPEFVGQTTQAIRCEDVTETWSYEVSESSIKVEAETESLALYLTSYGRSNNEENPGIWKSGTIECEFENFNFITDGWVSDDDEITVMRVSGDARLNIPYRIFESDFRSSGKTIEFEIATREVLNYDAEVLTCYSGGRGFVITAQQLGIASEQSSLNTRYKEDEHIRVSIVAEKKNENRLLLCYINGIMSGAVQYPEDDDFSQAIPVGISIGSNDCTTDIYNIRIYDNDLSRFQILDNWVADTQNIGDRVDRFKRNDVYDDYGQVVMNKLPSDLPYMVIQCPELPQFKDDKKDCSGYFTDPVKPERSFVFSNAQIDVQGTSSQYYYRKNYKMKFKNGFVMQNGGTDMTYQMDENAVPTNVFTMKADVASSEGAFNVVLSMLYNELCPYKTPAQRSDPKVRQTIEGFPMVIFWDNGSETKFLGKYNFNNDKGTPEVFGFKSGDESWEIKQNGTDRVGFHSADFSGTDWQNDFEARYPDKNLNTTKLKELAEWLVSTDTDQETNNALASAVTYGGTTYTTDSKEYRLAKFSAELSNHFIEEAIIFYYLYTEIFLSIDQREKNAFPTYLADEGKWIVLFYDADSSCGTDNKGNLTFDYYLEDIDYTEGGDPVYNGQNSVLWKNLRETRKDEIAAMYKELRTRTGDAVGYDKVIKAFEDHQNKWPEAIFNEDMYTKCIEPLILSGDGTYLPMLQGKKEQWMKWWLYNRFRYLDSKYVTGTSMTNRITIRTHEQENIWLTAYANIYGRVYYNDEVSEHRMERNKAYEFEWKASGAEDTVIGINDADMLTSLGDLAPLKPELVDVSKAIHLTSLKLGDGAGIYSNPSLNNVTFGNNILLRTIDVRNCPNLTQAVDISGCTNVEEVYFDGTSITGLKLPNGGILKTLKLPGTMTNLTLRNQKELTTFSMPSYANVSTLRLENNSDVIDPLAIFNGMPANSRVRIIGFNAEMTNTELFAFIEKLNTMRGLDEEGNNTDLAQISGTIHVEEITPAENKVISEAQRKYPDLKVTYDVLVPYTVRFFNYDGTLLETVYVEIEGEDAVYSDGIPTRGEGWEFTGWEPEPTNITGDRDCYATYYQNFSYARQIIQRTISGDYVNNRVTNVGQYAFYDCTNLTQADFGNVTSIGAYAFSASSSNQSTMKALVLRTNTVCTLDGANALSHNLNNGYIYVPAALVDSYKTTRGWSTYATKFRALEDYTVDGTVTGALDPTKI